jgi:hypothetical protein
MLNMTALYFKSLDGIKHNHSFIQSEEINGKVKTIEHPGISVTFLCILIRLKHIYNF